MEAAEELLNQCEFDDLLKNATENVSEFRSLLIAWIDKDSNIFHSWQADSFGDILLMLEMVRSKAIAEIADDD